MFVNRKLIAVNLIVAIVNASTIMCMSTDYMTEAPQLSINVQSPLEAPQTPPPPYDYFAQPVDYFSLVVTNPNSTPTLQGTNLLLSQHRRNQNIVLIKSAGFNNTLENSFNLIGAFLALNGFKDLTLLVPLLHDTSSANFTTGVMVTDFSLSLASLIAARCFRSAHAKNRDTLNTLLYKLDGLPAHEVEAYALHPAYISALKHPTDLQETDPLLPTGQTLTPSHTEYAKNIAQLINIGSGEGKVTAWITLSFFLMLNGIKDAYVFSDSGLKPTLTSIVTLGANITGACATGIAAYYTESKTDKRRAAFAQTLAELDALIQEDERLNN